MTNRSKPVEQPYLKQTRLKLILPKSESCMPMNVSSRLFILATAKSTLSSFICVVKFKIVFLKCIFSQKKKYLHLLFLRLCPISCAWFACHCPLTSELFVLSFSRLYSLEKKKKNIMNKKYVTTFKIGLFDRLYLDYINYII